MFGIRQKLWLGFGGLLLIMIGIGILTTRQLNDLGRSIDVILRENYRSVIACQNMREALEQINGGVLFSLLGDNSRSKAMTDDGIKDFSAALQVELNNITLPGEGQHAIRLQKLFKSYRQQIANAMVFSHPLNERRQNYYAGLPVLQEIRVQIMAIMQMNQNNMYDANQRARADAVQAQRRMLIAIIAGIILSIVYGLFMRRWILNPIRTLIASTEDVRHGNLELVVKTTSRDEIGQLSESFNAMTESLRQVRRSERGVLLRTRQAAEEIFQTLPEAVAVFDLNGRVELASAAAGTAFGLRPGDLVGPREFEWLTALIDRAAEQNRPVEHHGVIQRFINEHEYFFKPLALPIADRLNPGEAIGVSVIFKDVTVVQEQQELKGGVIATVSHQLRTPLTSLRMSVHLLLEETLGELTPKQTELLVAAREDCERLVGILNDLLDINRIEAGRELMEIQPIATAALINRALEQFSTEAKDKGIKLQAEISDGLPGVLADAGRIGHAFFNLLSNALRYTKPGGTVKLQAENNGDMVIFRIIDNGCGIPAEYLNRVFETFFRVPGQDKNTGVGLGLAIVREIITAHGGMIGVKSDPGQGANFWFTLPCAEKKQVNKGNEL